MQAFQWQDGDPSESPWLALTAFADEDGRLVDALTSRHSDHPHQHLLVDGVELQVPEGTAPQLGALAALGITTIEHLREVDLTLAELSMPPVARGEEGGVR